MLITSESWTVYGKLDYIYCIFTYIRTLHNKFVIFLQTLRDNWPYETEHCGRLYKKMAEKTFTSVDPVPMLSHVNCIL